MTDVATLADRAIDALARVKAMRDGLEMHHPERHQVRQLQRLAEKLLTDAFVAADSLAWQASDLRTLAREIERDCKPDNASDDAAPTLQSTAQVTGRASGPVD